MESNANKVYDSSTPWEDNSSVLQQSLPEHTIDDNTNDSLHQHAKLQMDDIYSHYKEHLIPAIFSSMPLLFQKIKTDSSTFLYNNLIRTVHFLVPWTREDFEWNIDIHMPKNPHVLEAYGNLTQSLLRNFDINQDGHISASELIQVTSSNKPQFDFFHIPSPPKPLLQSWLHSLTSWPIIHSDLSLFLWKSCGGLLILIMLASIIPGRLHRLTGLILRWPILALTYLTITSELIVYIMVRLFIRLAETIFATKKHRALRKSLEKAKTYTEWRTIARQLDYSQGRDTWQYTIEDDTSFRYNWAFINELIADMRQARRKGDTMLALVVLQQCTRKNVGGIMNEDLFSYTNSGEPKVIVKSFLEEVETTLRWLTEKCNTSSAKTSNTRSSGYDGYDVHTDSDTDTDDDGHEDDEIGKDASMHDSQKKHATIIEHVEEDRHNIIEQVAGSVGWILNAISKGHEHKLGNQKMKGSKGEKDKMKEATSKQKVSKQLTRQVSIDPAEKLRLEEREQVKIFLKRARAAYGRTALCLSGGAMMGCYHFGHAMALVEEGVLPHIISGTSAGSVIAAALCTRTNEEIMRDFKPEILVNKLTCFTKTWPDRMRFLYKNGCLFDQNDWLELIEWFSCGDMTFEEAYRKTGRILCITLSSTTKKAPPVLVNYITAPHVTIASAIVASAAVPGFIKPVILRKKGPDGVVREQAENKDESYWDGSIDQDIPTFAIAEMFNCQFFLTAQCNPHIVPFFFESKGCVAQPSRWSRGQKADAWRGGFLLAAVELYLKTDMRAKCHFLNDLEAAVGFTSTMMTQMYSGTTTIVPQVSLTDYFKLFTNPSLPFLKKCFQVGSVAAYQHCAMMKLHYSVSNAMDECLALLEEEEEFATKPKRRTSQVVLSQFCKGMTELEAKQKIQRGRGYSLSSSAFPTDIVDLHDKGSDHLSEDDTAASTHDCGSDIVQVDNISPRYTS